MPLSVGDATLSFLADTTQLDEAFARIPEQADASMSAAADSIDKVGLAAKGVTFELDATGSNAAYAGENFGKLTKELDATRNSVTYTREDFAKLLYSMAVGQNGAVRLGEVMNLAGEKTRESMYQARGEGMLLGEMFGVHLPRHVMAFLAELPGIGAALSGAFAATAVIFLIEKIVDLIAKHEQLALEQRHAAEESENLTIKQQDLVLGLHAANLALEDQISKLEGRPAVNTLVIALLATKKAVDDLATSYAADFQKMDKVVEDQLGLWTTLKRDAIELALAFHEVLTLGVDSHGETNARLEGDKAEVAALNALIVAQTKLNEARQKLADQDPSKDMEAWKAAAGAVAIAAGAVQSAADTAKAAVEKVEPDAHKLIGTLTDKATTAKGEWKAMAEEITKTGLEAKKARDEIANAAAELGDKRFKEQAQEAKQEAQQEETMWAEHYKEAVSRLQESEREKIAATKQGSQARIAAIDAAIKEEQSKGLQDTQFYKSLQTQKVEAVKAEAAAEQKIIVESLAATRIEAHKSLSYAKEDAREQLQILVAGLKEEEAALQAKEQRGLLTKKQVLIATEELQRQETAAKIAALKQEAAAEKEALDVEEQALKLALTQITDENEFAKVLDRVLAIETQRSALANKFASDEHVASIQGQKDLDTTEGRLQQLEKTWTTYFNQMHRDLPSIGQAIRTELQGSIDTFNKRFSADFAQMLVTGKGFGQAMKSLGQDMAKSFISMLTEMLLKWVETQIAMKILGISSSKATASAEIAASAAMAGANMVASWSAAPWPIDAAAPAMGAMAYADALAYEGLVLATGGLVTGPTLAMFGEKGDEAVIPLTDPLAMERISNALLSSPTMRLASAGMSDPTAIALASNVKQGGLDDAAMAKLGDIIGTHLDASGSAGDVTHVHVNIKGSVDHGTIAGLVKKINQGVGNRRLNLKASDSLRITRRSQ